MTTIGPTFASELAAAGLGGVPCSWSSDGTYVISQLTSGQQQTFLNVLAAHNSSKLPPQTMFANAIAGGLTTTWSPSTALNGVYPADPTIQMNISAENVSLLVNSTFTNGQTTRAWPLLNGSTVTMTIAQFKALATAIALFVDQLYTAQTAALANQTATWPTGSTTISA